MKKQFWLTLCLGLALLPASAQAKTLTDGTSGIINAPSGMFGCPAMYPPVWIGPRMPRPSGAT